MNAEFTRKIVRVVKTEGLSFGFDLSGNDEDKRVQFINRKMRVNDVKVPIGLIEYKQFYEFLKQIYISCGVRHPNALMRQSHGATNPPSAPTPVKHNKTKLLCQANISITVGSK